MKTQDEVDIISLGKAVERLRTTNDFRLVIESEYMTKRMLDIGKTFSGSNEEISMIKSISDLNGFLEGLVGSAKILQMEK